jgi:hypothetical protein
MRTRNKSASGALAIALKTRIHGVKKVVSEMVRTIPFDTLRVAVATLSVFGLVDPSQVTAKFRLA